MRILLTNDDGIRARGMQALRRIAAELSDDVWVCAPETQQSAQSRSVTLYDPVRLRAYGERDFSVTGTPTDSVIVALRDLLADHPPDLILSGVNSGQNLAEDVTFSGTVAGALQGMAMGIPSIALSLARGFREENTPQWETAETHGATVLQDLLDRGWPERVVLNLNFPDTTPDDVKGVQFTRQGHRDFPMSHIVKRDHPRGGDYFWLTYGAKPSDPAQGTDLRAIYDGYISVTPLHTDLTHVSALKALQDG